MPITALEPWHVIRQSGTPAVEKRTFFTEHPNGNFVLTVTNGGLADDATIGSFVSSSTIALNGAVVVGPQNFNQDTATVSVPVSLASVNTLEVKLQGKPGGVVTVEIAGEVNTVPFADAGVNQTVLVGSTVSLDGGGSFDDDGDALQYRWTLIAKPSGSLATLNDAASPSASFSADAAGYYVAELIVNDGQLNSSPSQVTISVLEPNAAPVLNPIGNQTVALGTALTLPLSATDPDGDTLQFSALDLPLPEGASLDGATGLFTFKPEFQQIGTIELTFTVSDGRSIDSETVTLTIPPINETAATRFKGRLLDANDYANGIVTPIVGATVSFLNNGAAAQSDSQGYFTLTGLAAGTQVLDIDSKTALNSPAGGPYAGFREQYPLIAHVENIQERPFFLPRIAVNSLTLVDPELETVVANAELGVTLTVPAHTAINPDGSEFTGQLSISLVPKGFEPANMPAELDFGQLVTIQPVGLEFASPVPITFPNLDGFEPGNEVEIWSVDPEQGAFVVVGVGEVSADGQTIQTVSGGIRATDWHSQLPLKAKTAGQASSANCDPCKKNSETTNSRLATQSGELSTSFALPAYVSQGQNRAPAFVYESQRAWPNPVIPFDATINRRSVVPNKISHQAILGGVAQNNRNYQSTAGLSESLDEMLRMASSLDAGPLESGIYPYTVLVTNHFGSSSRTASLSDQAVIVNGQRSPFGAGWGLAGLSRLHTSRNGDKLLISGNGLTAHYRIRLESPEFITTGAFELAPPPLSTVQGSYESNTKIKVFVETEKHILPKNIPADITQSGFYSSNASLTPGIVPAGTNVNSFYVHYDGIGTAFHSATGAITFPFEILGIAGLDNTLLASDKILGFPDTLYSTEVAHGNEFSSDFVTLSDDRRTLTYEPKLTVQTDHLRVITVAGAVNSKAIFESQDGDYSTLQQNDDGGFTLTLKNGTQIRFNAEGLQTEAVDRIGNSTFYAYNDQQQLVTITDPVGQVTTFAYLDNRLDTVTDPAGRITRFQFDNDNNLVKVIFPDGAFKRFGYDHRHLMTTESDENGYTGVREYRGDGRILQVTRADGSVHRADYEQTVGMVDAAGGIGTEDNPAPVVRPEAAVSTFTDGNDHTETTQTDRFGRLIRRTDANGLTTRIERDQNGNPVKTIRPDGSEIQRTFDERGNLTTETENFNGAATEATYDPVFNLITSIKDAEQNLTTFTRNPDNGNLEIITNALGHETRFKYNDAGQIREITDPNGLVTEYAYNAQGLPETVTETPPVNGGLTRTTTLTYDAAGQIRTLTTPDNIVISLTYDERGRLETVTDHTGQTIEYRIDAAGNRIRINARESDGTLTSSIAQTFDALNRGTAVIQPHISGLDSVRQFGYDGDGNLDDTTDAKNQATTFEYDPDNRLNRRIDAMLGTTHYAYDDNGRLKQVIAPNGAQTDYDTDPLGRIIKEISPDRGEITYTYDRNDNLKTLIDARGVTRTYRYDALNRLTAIAYPDAQENVILTYDTCAFGIGRLCRIEDESGVTDIQYDAYGNLTQIDQTLNGVGYSRHYHYDAGHRIIAMTLPSGRQVDSQRDSLGRIQAITTQLNGHPQTVLDNIRYNANDQITGQTFGNGLTETKLYDLQGRLISQTLGADQSTGLSYDANSNVLTRNTASDTHSYTYDTLDRLQSELNNGEAIGYQYDPNDNRTEKTQGLQGGAQSTLYDYTPQSNRLEAVDNQLIVLDDAGNLIQDQQGRSYVYNDGGRLKEIQLNGQILAQYRYNQAGQRTHKITATQTTIYHYDLTGNLIAETNADGALIKDYLWLNGNPIAQIDHNGTTETLTYLHTNHLDTPRLATDQNRTVVWRWEGEAFGNTPPQSFGAVINLRFPGQYFDQEANLHYNWNRYYDPTTGRYITSDPIGLDGGLNAYVYVNGNPVNSTDPTGEVGIVGAAIGIVVETGVQLALNGGRLECLDVGDILIAGAVGAVAPGAISSVKKLKRAFSASRALSNQASRAKSTSRINKLNRRIKRHRTSIANELATQAAFQGGKAIAKKTFDLPVSNKCSCN
ncbi:MAG: RHS repeat-associated core domain-containing protein [Gammaproteobacteria bacterium]